MPRILPACFSILIVYSVSSLTAAEPTRDQAAFFEKKVRPLLVEKCYKCHSESAKKSKGSLTVDTLSAMLHGGDTGPAIVPGHPEKSLLIEAVQFTNEDLQMPPSGKLSDADIQTLSVWVKMGAPWPNAGKPTVKQKVSKITDEDRRWWAFQPVVAGTPPTAGEGWAKNPIDQFIAAKLSEAGLTPAPEADRVTLIRRLSFDLIGLPPTPQEIDAYVNDASPNADEQLVDRLLSSPHYGERWARHWLDLVRYADSDGYRADEYRPNAWRYRDYVIRSFNNDKPYNRFVQEQLAGDELFPGNADALIATGYLRHWIYEYNNRDAVGQWEIILDDITDTTADVFLGMGLQCARCHDHKFDPLLQKDYYRLRAFFAAMMPRNDLNVADEKQHAEYEAKYKIWDAKTGKIRAEIASIEAPYKEKARTYAIGLFPEGVQEIMARTGDKQTAYDKQIAYLVNEQIQFEYNRIEAKIKGEQKERLVMLNRELAKFDMLKPEPLPIAFATTDLGTEAAPIVIPRRPDEPIAPGFLTILDEKPAEVTPYPHSTGRRAALATWLTRPENPLTARVIVNRVWQQHFGKGLAANASDFGKLGDLPTHPKLLDWLTDDFVRHGWSLKRLHRLIVSSATYRQSALHLTPKQGMQVDPENQLHWRGDVRRLDAEQIRDAVLSVTGELNPQVGGPGAAFTDPRLSIYTKIMRNTRDPLLDVFDAPLWISSAASRNTTTTPIQSLLLINSQMMLRHSKAFLGRLEKEATDEEERIRLAYRYTFGRQPTTEEVEAAKSFLKNQQERIDPKKADSAAARFVSGTIPTRDGQAADVKPNVTTNYVIPNSAQLPTGDFTLEAIVYARSIADTGAVRTIASKWNGSLKSPGWSFGISGKGSRRKPQTLVIQLIGEKGKNGIGEEAVFADHTLPLDKPCYVCVAVTLAKDNKPGQVTFYIKDLGNVDLPMLSATVSHTISGRLANTEPLVLGGRHAKSSQFDGLLDDVRISSKPLTKDELFIVKEGIFEQTVGMWRFEAKPGVFKDATAHQLDIRPSSTPSGQDAAKAAWVDLCHVLLNASEFLYVR